MQKNRHHKAPEFREDKIYRFVNESPETKGLLELVAENMPDRSRTQLKGWLRYGHMMANGEVTSKFDAPIAPGEEARVNVSRPFVLLNNRRLKIIYEDDDVIVVNKGYGLLSVGANSSKKEETAYDILRDYLKLKDPRNKLYVVHRLDRDTSGIMMFAKTEEAQETLRHNWNNYVLDRTYVALLEGYVKDDNGYVKSHLAENSKYVVYSTDNENEGKLAVTHYKVLKRGNGLTLTEFSLDTGRKNQIRVHAKDLGHPINGDRKYGAHTSKLNRLCLHARTLRFAHPITRKDMNFEVPVPQGFLKAVGGN